MHESFIDIIPALQGIKAGLSIFNPESLKENLQYFSYLAR